ncbi:MAG: hypothetical protein H6766_06230 [Candidatus Peribacteria bacterium]|nr:MAG: hypothetical protein H6766_06230 [Candidatus Peribacteria bacterium]
MRALCGEWHYKNYLSEAESVRAKLEADPTNANLLEAYADMEAKYIHQTIADNSSFKTFFSKKYSDAVIGAKWKGNDQERIDKTANVFGSQKDFELNEILFSVKIQNGDIGKTIGHLKAMAMTAQSSIQINKVRLYLLELMLSGMVLYQTKETTKETLQAIAAKIGFIPGTWVDNANQQHKIHTLLDYITGGNFSTQTNYNDNTFQRLNYGENIGDFHGKYKAWANSVEAQKVCDFLTLNDINEKGSRNLLTVIADGV